MGRYTVSRKRHICYLTGTRADFGLMQATLQKIYAGQDLQLSVVVTGTHLSEIYGHTVDEIRKCNFKVIAEIPVNLEDASGATMARNIAVMTQGLVDTFEKHQPDIVLLLGDRGEMLAGALAAIHLNIPIAHIHGGERSGTVDEPIRHAISKLAHIHFASTEDAKNRLIRMGEHEKNIYVSGAPGLDDLKELAVLSRSELCEKNGFDPNRKLALLVFHPVLQEASSAGLHVKRVMERLLQNNMQVVALMPNSDAGSLGVRQVLSQFQDNRNVRLYVHLPRHEFVSWMAQCDVMIGNSSSGIIEAATFGTPVINLGIRQNLRQRNANVVDVGINDPLLGEVIAGVIGKGRLSAENCYGDGLAGNRIVDTLANLLLSPDLLLKANAY